MNLFSLTELIKFEDIAKTIGELERLHFAKNGNFLARVICSPNIYFCAYAFMLRHYDDFEYANELFNQWVEGGYGEVRKLEYKSPMGRLVIDLGYNVSGIYISSLYEVVVRNEDNTLSELSTYNGQSLNEIETIINQKACDHYVKYMRQPQYLVLSEHPYIVFDSLIKAKLKSWGAHPFYNPSGYSTDEFYNTGYGRLKVIHLLNVDKNIIEVG